LPHPGADEKDLVVARRNARGGRSAQEHLVAALRCLYQRAVEDGLMRLHTETACRRGGALALRPQDLDPDQCLVLLREKGETVRWQPVSPTLMGCLTQHGQDRRAPADGQLLRYAGGRPVTSRRYDHRWTRIGRHLPWVRTQQRPAQEETRRQKG
jgi:integrase